VDLKIAISLLNSKEKFQFYKEKAEFILHKGPNRFYFLFEVLVNFGRDTIIKNTLALKGVKTVRADKLKVGKVNFRKHSDRIHTGCPEKNGTL